MKKKIEKIKKVKNLKKKRNEKVNEVLGVKKKKDRGISTVVATVMMIVLTTVGVSVIAAFIIPMVQKEPTQQASCFGARDHLKITAAIGNVETCWKAAAGTNPSETAVIVNRGTQNDVIIDGFSVSLAKEGSSRRFDVIFGRDNPDVTTIEYRNLVLGCSNNGYNTGVGACAAQEEFATDLQMGSEYTYYFNSDSLGGEVVRVQIAPILKGGETCPVSDELDIGLC
jgi:hypothetical protein